MSNWESFAEKYKSSCAVKPNAAAWKKMKPDANGNITFGLDPHQTWQKRFDRNFLRNADLRKTLGCTLSREVPFACSPLGYSKSVMIK